MSDFIIDVTSPENQFSRHLNMEKNRRIIFSGVFGSGKTWFLDRFFFKKFKDTYFTIRLAPVNYSVSSNEDIFELIKFDILFELLKEGISSSEVKSSKEFLLQHIFLLDPEKSIQSLLEKADKTGHDILRIENEIEKILGIDSSSLQNTSQKAALYRELNQFIAKHSSDRGKIYERNALSKLLNYLIAQQKKETVLIIDDLDRIDPEHIFRIMNAFSAQFDLDPSGENKFGFNRIIVVCDLDNIRRIFATRYGQATDFSGYIDKFFSHKVFSFDNTTAVLDRISEIVSKLTPLDDHTNTVLPMHQRHHIGRELVVYIFQAFLRLNLLNLRSIHKLYTRKAYAIEPKVVRFRTEEYGAYQFLILSVLSFIQDVVGDFDSMRDKLQICVDKKIGVAMPDYNDSDHKYKLGSILPILKFKELGKNQVVKYFSPHEDILFKFEIKQTESFKRIFWADNITIHPQSDENTEVIVDDIFPYLLNAADTLKGIGAIK